MTNAIHILHLSDLHIDPGAEGETKPVFDALCEKLVQFRKETGKDLDLLIISGDLVNQGAGNYDVAGARIHEVLAATGLTKEQVFLVPGNHDVTWKDVPKTKAFKFLINTLKDQPAEFESLDSDSLELISRGFAAYQKFAAQFPLAQQNPYPLPGFARADLDIAGVPVRLCGLNSAVLAGPFDKDKLDKDLHDRIIGKKWLADMLGGPERLNLVVSHYPLSWINEYENAEVKSRLKAMNAILFNGHVHASDPQMEGVQANRQLLELGVGSMYGEKWLGRNHCQILELNFEKPAPVLHEWFWFSQLGWRGMEPLELNFQRWDYWRKKSPKSHGISISPLSTGPGFAPGIPPFPGLVSIGDRRPPKVRTDYYCRALEMAKAGSEMIVVGRSLIDFSLLKTEIESAINDKKIHMKLALLDANTIRKDGSSWIEAPVKDWSIGDVPASMQAFRRIRVKPNGGRLSIYGLPFYSLHSFIAFTSQEDDQRYCLDELGMGLDKGQRPYIELWRVAPGSFAETLDHLYEGFLTDERLLLDDIGGSDRKEPDTTRRAKIINDKVEQMGLVDISVGRAKIDWKYYNPAIQDIIDQTPEGGEILLVGRSLISWTEHKYYEEMARAVVLRNVHCTFIMADPNITGLQSLVAGDYAKDDLLRAWGIFTKAYPAAINELIKKHPQQQVTGKFELFGIPAYLPETFAVYTRPDGVKYCTLETGIGVKPWQRPILYFENVSEQDVFTHLYQIYRSITNERTPAVSLP